MPTRYVFYSRVRKVYQRSRVTGGRLVEGQAVLQEEDLGWFILTDNMVAVGVGMEKPDVAVGAWMRQTLEPGEPPSAAAETDQPPTVPLPPVIEAMVMARSLVMSERRAAALGSGYTGDLCGECGCLTMVRNGTCLKCNTCGATSGCS